MSEVLKRKFEEVEGDSPCSSSKDSEEELSGSESVDSGDSVNPPADTHFTPSSILHPPKRQRGKSVRFGQVTVFHFPRRQGFTSVPSQGGSTLGMANHHDHVAVYSLGEFARERENAHQHVLRQHLKEERLNALRMQLTQNGTQDCDRARALTVEDIPDEEVDVRAVQVDDYFFLQPLPTRKRRAMLRASGVRRIDGDEKQQLRAIRVSREECGCDCRAYCDPETCPCSQAGISCQVDRLSFPCGCTKDGCGNPGGRIEFNPVRVRTHFIHTIMRLELERKQAGCDDVGGPLGGPGVDGGLVHGAVERACGSFGESVLPQEMLGMSGRDNSPMMQLFAADVMSGDVMSGEDGDPDSPSSGFASTLCSSEDGGDGTTGVEYRIPSALHLGRVEGELHVKGERVGEMSSYSLDSSLFSFPSDDLPSMSLFPSNSSSASCLFHGEEYGLSCVQLHGAQDAPTLQEMSPAVDCAHDRPGASPAAHAADATPPPLAALLQDAPAGVVAHEETRPELGAAWRDGPPRPGACREQEPPRLAREQREAPTRPRHGAVGPSTRGDVADGGGGLDRIVCRGEAAFEIEAEGDAALERLSAGRSPPAGRSDGGGEAASPPTNGSGASAAESGGLVASTRAPANAADVATHGIEDERDACRDAPTYGLAGRHLAPNARVSKGEPFSSFVANEPERVLPREVGAGCGASGTEGSPAAPGPEARVEEERLETEEAVKMIKMEQKDI
ncbi:cysteine/serine-rich nuclear protein 2-like isoform X2 [Lethenteron reissneri]|uniref:cysteine/serine-rich nuclear protein 2-like isoform X2 n=1 Tax=Lethenteron reissneri TaxID=7753 RepID=UPI002AB69F37|nr:cysteine/serine-rich nuclear protein 2-like isoform X2 [Lethenteron reissneri]